MTRFHCPKSLLRLALQNHTYLITGVSKGLGQTLAKQLLKQGATVHGLSRTKPKWRHPKFVWYSVDLSDLKVVNQFCHDWSRDNTVLDGIINNAAVIPSVHTTTAEGFEMQWTVNYLSAVLLTGQLASKLHSITGRIVNVSSTAHHSVHGRLAAIHFDDIHSHHRSYDQWAAYAQSKLALTIYTRQLAEKHTDVGIASVHPGWVATDIAPSRLPQSLYPTFDRLLRRKGLCTEWEGIQPILAALLLPKDEIHSGEMLCQIGYYDGISSNQKASHMGWLLPSPNPIVYDQTIGYRLEKLTTSQLSSVLDQS